MQAKEILFVVFLGICNCCIVQVEEKLVRGVSDITTRYDIWMTLCKSEPTLKFIILQKTFFFISAQMDRPVVHRRVVGWSIGFNRLLNILMG